MFTLLLLSRSFSNSNAWGQLRLAPQIHSSPISASSVSSSYGDRPFIVPSRTKRIRNAICRIAPFRSSNRDDSDYSILKSENSILRDAIRQLEEENLRLKKRAQRVVGLETFEGERFFRDEMDAPMPSLGGITLSGEEIAQDDMWCDQLEEGETPGGTTKEKWSVLTSLF